MKKSYLLPVILLVLALISGALMRFWQLGSAPKGALVDEAHFGYIAYSLLATGRDEHSSSWPVIFKGFGDDKLPAYAYSLMPVVASMGLSTLSIRVPSALAGSVLPLVSGFLMLAIFWKNDKRWWAFSLAAVVTAFSPWSIFLSRFGLESNLALFLFTLGLSLLGAALQSPKYHKIFLVSSGISLALTWYAYISYRPITALILIFCSTWLFYSDKKTNLPRKSIFIWILAFVLTVLPLFQPAAISSFTSRYKQVGITSDTGLAQKINEQRTFCNMQLPLSVCSLLWNKPLEVISTLASRYLHVFSPQYLVTQGEKDTPFLTVDQTGQFFPLVYPLLIIGLVAFICFPKTLGLDPLAKWLVLLGLIVTPIPTILAGEAQKVRMSALFPFILILIVAGALSLTSMILNSRHKHGRLALSCFWLAWGVIYSFSGLRFVSDFIFIHSLKNDALYQSYLPESYEYLSTFSPETRVVIRPFFSDPIMFYAFYNHLDPQKYQSSAVLGEKEASGFQHTVNYNNIFVKDVSLDSVGCEAEKLGQRAVFMTNEELDFVEPLKVIRSANGSLRYVYFYDATAYVKQKNAC